MIALKQRQKLVDNSGTALQSFIQNLINVQKATTLALLVLKACRILLKAGGSTTNSTKLLQSALTTAKQNLDKFKPNTPEWQQLTSAIQQGNALLKSYWRQTTQSTTGTTTNFLTQLRQLRYEMQQMEAAGLVIRKL
jgi:hypothetical protein